jgi:hypothetical protein
MNFENLSADAIIADEVSVLRFIEDSSLELVGGGAVVTNCD